MYLQRVKPYVFQSALPRGERRNSGDHSQEIQDFNPRSREGSDIPANGYLMQTDIFQSALPRGERLLKEMEG